MGRSGLSKHSEPGLLPHVGNLSIPLSLTAVEDNRQGWEEFAACRNFPHQKGVRDPFDVGQDRQDVIAAQAFCGACPVKAECLDEAMEREGGQDLRMRSMIRGGLTPLDRFRKRNREMAREKRERGKAA